jgi:MoxR-like ATPase
MTKPSLPLSLATEKPRPLPALRHWPATRHVFDEDSLWAINAALQTGRPLLLRGDPGVGKSQLARAAADALGWPFLSRVINGRCEPEDLLYRFDAVARLAQAQILPREADFSKLDAAGFLLPEVLWWALAPVAAREQFMKASAGCGLTADAYDARACGHDFDPDKGVVVLLDEIDKADTEVPNGLLEILSLGGFQLPYGAGYVKPEGIAPLILITTNEDRELPPAFLRRCLVHQMDLPKDRERFESHLFARVRAHFTEHDVPDELVRLTIRQLVEDREKLRRLDLPLPGQAELLDLLHAVVGLTPTGGDPSTTLARLKGFAFDKHRPT